MTCAFRSNKTNYQDLITVLPGHLAAVRAALEGYSGYQ